MELYLYFLIRLNIMVVTQVLGHVCVKRTACSKGIVRHLTISWCQNPLKLLLGLGHGSTTRGTHAARQLVLCGLGATFVNYPLAIYKLHYNLGG
jgi:hypothetical protein